MSTVTAEECLTCESLHRHAPEPAEVAVAQRRSWRRPVLLGSFGVLALMGALAAGVAPRIERHHELRTAATEAATQLPRVLTVSARAVASSEERVLPGSAQPLLQADLYARATGYIKQRLVDIGDRVEAGQVLAVIDAPDIDDQLAQAKADLAQAKANLVKARADEAYAAAVVKRDRRLVSTRAISQQEYEKSVQDYGVASAAIKAMEAAIKVNEAAVQRYTDLQAFEKIVAPFPGVITARHIDPGDLVTANSTSLMLFQVMQTDTLRVFVNVPQAFATQVQVGQKALIFRREDPRQTFTGTVTRTANALDPATRTLLTEVQVPNKAGALRPGLYLQVKFLFPRQAPSVVVPSAALVIRSGAPRVAILDSQHHIHYKTVELGRDFGTEVEVVTGLNADATVVVRPGDDLPEGAEVEVATPAAVK